MDGALQTLAALLPAAAAIAAAAVGGIFFAFSSFIMAGLARRPPAEGAAAMQAINVTVLNPAVFALLFGTVALTAGAALAAPSAPAVAAVALYAIGCVGVTGLGNVPLNERLRKADASAPETEALWREYLTRWTRWNHVRTAACFAAAGLALAG